MPVLPFGGEDRPVEVVLELEDESEIVDDQADQGEEGQVLDPGFFEIPFKHRALLRKRVPERLLRDPVSCIALWAYGHISILEVSGKGYLESGPNHLS